MSRDGEGTIDALNWSGEAYKAIILIDGFRFDDDDDDDSLEGVYATSRASPRVRVAFVAAATGFTHYDAEKEDNNIACSADEVETAMSLFRDCVHARDLLRPERTQAGMTRTFPWKRKVAGCFTRISLPEESPNDDERSENISFLAKQRFPRNGHPAPDPVLPLLSKSVFVLQARHRLQDDGPRTKGVDEVSPSDQSIQAEEDFLRRREQARTHRDPLGMDIHVG
eukprot:CAMPEP_0197184820 /NCGR_PEP_ID=MMETSP1423-20130617/10655_1 /TAXON_ID=476441 /ORGANISM="Pseudo-nitzschia heimii, Strain UNC1101" /LENGTH=224 /DNA_ID=CAMNT_0042635737 /DNA_START=1035 /DNA_END=1710 /DNA_ORIENTATION=-